MLLACLQGHIVSIVNNMVDSYMIGIYLSDVSESLTFRMESDGSDVG